MAKNGSFASQTRPGQQQRGVVFLSRSLFQPARGTLADTHKTAWVATIGDNDRGSDRCFYVPFFVFWLLYSANQRTNLRTKKKALTVDGRSAWMLNHVWPCGNLHTSLATGTFGLIRDTNSGYPC